MKYMLISTAVLLLCLAASWLISKKIESVRKRSLWVCIVFIIALTFLLLSTAALLYFSMYYQAEAAADAALKDSDSVTVRRENHMLVFDGPGRENAVVFYPGAKVEAKAYAPLMKRLAEAGTDCVLLDPPLHFPLLDGNGIERAYKLGSYDNWYIAGHSLGGTMAALYAAGHPEKIAGVILLGAYPTSSLADTRLLSMYGSEDRILEREGYEKRRNLWPKDAQEHVIQGGNHSGFGNYGLQKGDGTAGISQDAQQKETAEYIHSFVSQKSKS